MKRGAPHVPSASSSILVGVDHVRRRERGAQQGDGVGRPHITRKEQCPRQPPTGLDPDPEEVTFRAGSAGSDEPDTPTVTERRRGVHERADFRDTILCRDDRERPPAALAAKALQRAQDRRRVGVGDGHDQAQIRSPGGAALSVPAAPRGHAPRPRRVRDPAKRREGGAGAPEGRRAPVPRRQSTGPALASRVGAGERGPVTIRRWGYPTASSWGRDLRMRTRK